MTVKAIRKQIDRLFGDLSNNEATTLLSMREIAAHATQYAEVLEADAPPVNWNSDMTLEELWSEVEAMESDKMNPDGLVQFRQLLVDALPKRPPEMSLDQYVARLCVFLAHKFYDPALPANRLFDAEHAIWKEMEPRFDAPDADREALNTELRERARALACIA